MRFWDLLKTVTSAPPPGLEGRSELVFAAGEPELPLTSAFLEKAFQDPDCKVALLMALSKPTHERTEVEHIFFTTYLMRLVEMGFRGELGEFKEQLEEMSGSKPKGGGKPKKRTGKAKAVKPSAGEE